MPVYESTEEYLNSTQIGRQIIRIRENVSDALIAIGAKGVTVPSGSNSDDLADLIAQISGGSSSGQTATGTVTGTGTNVLEIPCSFAPDLIYVRGDLSGDVSNRGVVSFTIIKNEYIDVHSDASQSADSETLYYASHDITGYNESDTSNPHASYANGVLTLTSINSSSTRFTSGQTYTYELSTIGTGGGGSSATLVTKSITANGTYSAEDDDADGYSEVTVNVPQPSGSINITENGTHDVANYASAVVNVSSGASNVISGTFTGTTTNAAMNITLPYRGNGYPVAIVVYPTEGPYNSASGSFYNKIQRYGCAYFSGIKARANSAPAYNGSAADTIATYSRYKNSSSSATSYSGSAANNTSGFSSSDAQNTVGHIVHFKPNNVLSVFIASTSYGFIAGIEYTYHIIYSE